MLDVLFEITELRRRLSQLIQYGVIAEVYGTRARARIGDLLTAPLPWLTARAGEDIAWWQPRVDEQVVVLAPSGDLAQGVILPALYQDRFPAPSSDPELFKLVIGTCTLEIERSGAVRLETPEGVTLDCGLLTVDAEALSITAEAVDIDALELAVTGDVTAAGISLQNHVHPGVTSGPSVTGPPQ